MSKTAYTHYQPFTKGILKGLERSWKLAGNRPKDFDPDGAIRDMLHSPRFSGSIDMEIMALEYAFQHHEGRVLIPHADLCHTLYNTKMTPVTGESWHWPFTHSTVSVPTSLKFASRKAEALMVTWIDSSEIAQRVYPEFLKHWRVDLPLNADRLSQGKLLLIAFRGDPEPIMPSMMRYGFTVDELTTFINEQAVKDATTATGALRQGSEAEREAAMEAVRFVISLGFYMASYPGTLVDGVPDYVGTKLPKDMKGRENAAVGMFRSHELNTSLTPYSVAPFWRQLRHEKYYQGDYMHLPRGARYTLVSGYDVNKDRAVAVEKAPEATD